MTKTVFMVSEKPSLASSIANILSNHHATSRKGIENQLNMSTKNNLIIAIHVDSVGFNGACSVHEWNGIFKGESVHFKMTSVCGHVN